jgi:hypothetical protein
MGFNELKYNKTCYFHMKPNFEIENFHNLQLWCVGEEFYLQF